MGLEEEVNPRVAGRHARIDRSTQLVVLLVGQMRPVAVLIRPSSYTQAYAIAALTGYQHGDDRRTRGPSDP